MRLQTARIYKTPGTNGVVSCRDGEKRKRRDIDPYVYHIVEIPDVDTGDRKKQNVRAVYRRGADNKSIIVVGMAVPGSSTIDELGDIYIGLTLNCNLDHFVVPFFKKNFKAERVYMSEQ